VEKQLSKSNSRFIRIHQSYLVNFDYIKKMNFTNVELLDGTVLPISEDQQKHARMQFCMMAGIEVRNNA
jgi:DNA-binding LytR/AlgR family response regulator